MSQNPLDGSNKFYKSDYLKRDELFKKIYNFLKLTF